MNQFAFAILFLYVRSFDFHKPEDFTNDQRQPKPEDEQLEIDKSNRQQQEKLLENLRKVEANYFLERRCW